MRRGYCSQPSPIWLNHHFFLPWHYPGQWAPQARPPFLPAQQPHHHSQLKRGHPDELILPCFHKYVSSHQRPHPTGHTSPSDNYPYLLIWPRLPLLPMNLLEFMVHFPFTSLIYFNWNTAENPGSTIAFLSTFSFLSHTSYTTEPQRRVLSLHLLAISRSLSLPLTVIPSFELNSIRQYHHCHPSSSSLALSYSPFNNFSTGLIISLQYSSCYDSWWLPYPLSLCYSSLLVRCFLAFLLHAVVYSTSATQSLGYILNFVITIISISNMLFS